MKTFCIAFYESYVSTHTTCSFNHLRASVTNMFIWWEYLFKDANMRGVLPPLLTGIVMGVFIQSHLSLSYKSSVSMCVLYVPSCPSVNFQAFVQTLKCFIKGPPTPLPPLPERTVKLTRSRFSYAKLVTAVWIWMFSSEYMFAKIKVRRYTLIGTLPYLCRTTYLGACYM